MPKYKIAIKADMEVEVEIGENPEDIRTLNTPEVMKDGFEKLMQTELDENMKFNSVEITVTEVE